MPANIAIGTYTGDGSAQTIQLGFVPQWVEIVNDTDQDAFWVWSENMADGTAANVSTGATLAANGVTPYSGVAAGNSKGFTIGSGLSESGKSFTYKAVRAAST